MKKLIYDTATTGHHSEYINHLIDYLGDLSIDQNEYYFVLNPKFEILFPVIYNKAKRISSIKWKPIESSEISKIRNSNNILGSLISMRIMNKYALMYEIDDVIALDFHSIKYGAIFRRPKYSLTSILFLQFYRLQRNTFSEKLEYYKRYFITKLCSKNRKIKTIFVLNDEETVQFMNSEFNTHCFKMLPDPIPELQPMQGFDIYKHYKIEPRRKIFLHIGALGNRKGTSEVIESAFFLKESVQNEIAILLVGKASKKEDEKKFERLINAVKSNTDVQILWDNQFVPVNVMKSIFNQCNTVLLPYKNAEFSSGILGHAAAAGKRVIATNAGLIKELVVKYELGELLDKADPSHTAAKISEILEKPYVSKGQEYFVNQHKPSVFAKMILNS